MGRNWRNGNHCFKEFGVQEANASRKRDVQLGNVFKFSNTDILKLFFNFLLLSNLICLNKQTLHFMLRVLQKLFIFSIPPRVL